MDTPTNTLEEKRKNSVELINLKKFATLRRFSQRMAVAKKINEIIISINKNRLE